MIARGLAGTASLLWLLALASGAQAKVVFVYKDSPGPTRDGTSWAQAFQTIQAGINAAAAADEVWVAASPSGYAERLTMKASVAVYGGFAGTEANRSERNPAANQTVVDGTGGVTVTFPASAPAATILDGFTLQKGTDNVALAGGSPVVSACIITLGTRHGVTGTAGTATISACTISQNAQHGITLSGGAPMVTGNTVTANGNSGIYCTTTAGTFTQNVVTHNRDHGIRADGSPATIADNTVTDNGSGAGSGAGAISCSLNAAVATALTRNIVSNNGGSGISVSGGAPVVKNNRLFGNDGTQGGGLYVNGGSPTIAGNVVYSNVSFNEGGGLYLKNATAKVYNNTLSANASGGNGGAFYIEGGSAALSNNLFVYNSPGLYRASGTLVSRKNNVFANILYNYYNIVADPSDLSVDPMVAAPVARDLHIQASSPMRNAGDNAAVEAGDTDMDGQPRVQGGTVDIGADESDGTTYSIPTPIIRVKPNTDPVNPGNDANDGSDWTKAKATIQAAVDAAAGGGEVWVATGEYVEQVVLKTGVALYGGFTGIETLREQRDFSKWTTLINGGNSPAAITIPTGAGATETIDGFTIVNTRNNVTGNAAVTMTLAGAVIRNCVIGTAQRGVVLTNSSLEISNTTIRDTGGNAVECGAATVVATSVTLQSNASNGFSGTGSLSIVSSLLKNNASRGVSWEGALSLTDSTVEGNGGRAVSANIGSGLATLTGNTIRGNADGVQITGGLVATGNVITANGSGLNVDGSANVQNNTFDGNRAWGLRVSAPTATNNIIRGNTCINNSGDRGYGIGVALSGTAKADIIDNTVSGNFNTNTTAGGGISVSGAGATVTNNVVSGNASPSGGGLYLLNTTGLVANNVIIANGASTSGGGIYTSGGTPALVNNTLTANSAAGNGGAISVEAGSATVANNIIAYNSSGLFKAPVAAINLSHCLFWSNAAYDSKNISIAGSGNLTVDPMLAGAPARNVHIQPTSPARNAGDNTVVPAGWTDMDGQSRTQGGTVDIGADESDGTAYSTTPLVIRVNRLTGDDANSGATWGTAKKTIQAAINAAAGGGEVWVAKARYFERLLMKPGVSLYGGFAGTETSREQRDWVANETAIDGERLGVVLRIPSTSGANTVVDGFVIGSTTSGSTYPGIQVDYASTVIRNNRVSLNQTGIVASGAVLNLTSNVVELNQTDGISASANTSLTANANAIRNNGRHGVYAESGELTATDNTFAGNNAGWCINWTGTATISGNQANGNHRGFSVSGTATIGGNTLRETKDGYAVTLSGLGSVTGNTIERNSGGVSVSSSQSVLTGYSLLVEGNAILANAGSGRPGLTCSLTGSATALIRNNLIQGNSNTASGTSGAGGGAMLTGGQPEFTNNRLFDNSAASGAGLYLNKTAALVANNFIGANVASGNGGGIYILQQTTSLGGPRIVNNTIAVNSGGTTGQGGGIYADAATATVFNNIVAFNSGGGVAKAGAANLDLRFNDVYGNMGAGGTVNYIGFASDPTGTFGNISIDPKLGAPIARELHIQPDSPCRNTGDNALVVAGWTDIDGQARIQDGTVDIGADESDGTTVSVEPVVIRVNNQTGDDNNDGSTWAKAKRSIQGAIDAARGGGQIWVARGTGVYQERVTLRSGIELYGGFAGNETTLAQRNLLANPVAIDGQKLGNVVTVPSSAGATQVIDGFTIGNTTTGSTFSGVAVSNTALIIANCRITLNNYGVSAAGSLLTVTATTINNNQAEGISAEKNTSLILTNVTLQANGRHNVYSDSGEVVMNGGSSGGAGQWGLYWTGTATISGASFLNNQYGISVDGPVVLTDSVVRGSKSRSAVELYTSVNTAVPSFTNIVAGNVIADGDSAGLYVAADEPVLTGRTVTVSDNTIENNKGRGLAIETSNNATALVQDNVIRKNANGRQDTLNPGGGMWVRGAAIEIRNNVISENAAAYGAGVWFEQSEAVFANNVVTANGALANGGGIYINAGKPGIINNTLTGNSAAGDGGGLYSYLSKATIVNNILSFGTSGVWTNDSGFTFRHNNVYGNLVYDASGFVLAGNGNLQVDPKLAGAPTRNVHIQPTSPLRNAGDNSVVPGVVPPWTDMDGQARIQGGTVDIGADESDGTAYSTTPVIVRVNNQTGNDSNDGTTWAKAKQTIQAGIEAAAGGGEVWVARGLGVYGEQIVLRNGVALYGGFAGNESSRAERAVSANPTVIDANLSGVVVDIPTGTAATVVLDGFTLRNSGTSASVNLSGIRMRYASVVLANLIVQNNQYGLDAAGCRLTMSNVVLQNQSVNGALMQPNCVVTGDNVSVAGNGRYGVEGSGTLTLTNSEVRGSSQYGVVWTGTAGIANSVVRDNGYWGVSVEGTLNLTDSTVRNNGTVSTTGGVAVTGFATITGSNVQSNRGYGIQASASLPVLVGYTLTFINNSVTGNGANDRCGISATLTGAASALVQGNVISGNANTRVDSGGIGGGLWLSGGAPVVLNNIISGNSAGRGAGILASGADLMAASNLVFGNNISANAAGIGSGILVINGSPSLFNNTVAGNVAAMASNGGGVAFDNASALLVNNIIAQNNNGGVYKTGGGTLTLRYNDVYGNGVYQYRGIPDPLGTNLKVDPLFVDAAGGNYHLQSASTLKDAGDDTAVQFGWTDIDGQARKTGTHVDIGADEIVAIPATTLQFFRQPGGAQANRAFDTQPIVRAVNGSGVVDTTFNGPVVLAIKTGTGTAGAQLGGSVIVYAVNGVASFTNLLIDRAGSAYRLVATAGPLGPVDSAAFDVAPQPVKLAFQTQPANGTQNSPLSPAPVVVVQDGSGVTATGYTGPVTLSIKPGTGTPGALAVGQVTVNAVGGLATFPNVRIDTAGDGYKLVATSGALLPAESTAFNIAPSSISVGLIRDALGIAGGARTATPADMTNLNKHDPAGNRINLLDAVRLNRARNGLDTLN